ncbi:replication protein, partial [Staphylococcus aureus]
HAKLHFLKEGDLTVYFYIWIKKEYLASEIFDLTESEKQEINHQMIDEIEEEK